MITFHSIEAQDIGAIRSEAFIGSSPRYDERGYTILHIAAMKQWIKGINYILKERLLDVDAVDGEEMNQTSLYLSAFYGHEKSVKCLLGHGASVEIREDINGETPLHAAAKYGFTRVVSDLLTSG